MPRVDSITNNKPMLRADNTGYMAVAGMCLTAFSALPKNKSVRKLHKPFAFITAGLTLLHLGTVIHNRLAWQKAHKEILA